MWSVIISAYKSYSKKYLIIIGILIVGATLLRVNLANTSQMSRDEVYTFFVARENNLENLVLQKHWDTAHPPAYYVFSHYWQKLGFSPLILRLPSLIISITTLALVPVMTYAFGFSSLFSCFFLMFLTISPRFAVLMMLARPYFLELSMATLSLICFADILRGGRRLLNHFVIFSTLTFMADYSGVWLLTSYGFYWLISNLLLKSEKNNDLNIILFKRLCYIFVLIVPSIYLLSKHFSNSISLEMGLIPLFRGEGSAILKNLYQLPSFVSSLSSDFFVRTGLLSMDQWTFTLILISLVGLWKIFYANKKVGLYVVIFFLFPTIFSFVYSLYFTPIFLAINLNLVSFAAIFGFAAVTVWMYEINAKTILPVLIVFWISNCVGYGFNYIPYSDMPYDWEGLTKKISTRLVALENNNLAIVSTQPDYYFENIRYYALLNKQDLKYSVYSLKRAGVAISKGGFFVINFQNGEKDEFGINDWLRSRQVNSCRGSQIERLNYIDYLDCFNQE